MDWKASGISKSFTKKYEHPKLFLKFLKGNPDNTYQ